MGILSADMVLAVPLALISIILIASGTGNMQSFLSASAGRAYAQIRYYSISQQMISILSSRNTSPNGYASELNNLSAFYNISAYTTAAANYSACAQNFCRIVEVAGMERLMVIK